jgi:hypothetical protein
MSEEGGLVSKEASSQGLELSAPAAVDAAPSAWLLELGAVARRAEFRSDRHTSQGRRLRAWTSRRASARTRRRIVEQALVFAESPLAVTHASPEQLADRPFDPAEEVEPGHPELSSLLLDRISAYTTGSPLVHGWGSGS